MTSSLARKPSLARNHGDDARAEELEHLKLALATFCWRSASPGILFHRPTAAVDLGRTT
jgi:hypothetical protein